ncbi:hypothetical protein RQP46_005307 [Phenoliferia psychrophenolica]
MLPLPSPHQTTPFPSPSKPERRLSTDSTSSRGPSTPPTTGKSRKARRERQSASLPSPASPTTTETETETESAGTAQSATVETPAMGHGLSASEGAAAAAAAAGPATPPRKAHAHAPRRSSSLSLAFTPIRTTLLEEDEPASDSPTSTPSVSPEKDKASKLARTVARVKSFEKKAKTPSPSTSGSPSHLRSYITPFRRPSFAPSPQHQQQHLQTPPASSRSSPARAPPSSTHTSSYPRKVAFATPYPPAPTNSLEYYEKEGNPEPEDDFYSTPTSPSAPRVPPSGGPSNSPVARKISSGSFTSTPSPSRRPSSSFLRKQPPPAAATAAVPAPHPLLSLALGLHVHEDVSHIIEFSDSEASVTDQEEESDATGTASLPATPEKDRIKSRKRSVDLPDVPSTVAEEDESPNGDEGPSATTTNVAEKDVVDENVCTSCGAVPEPSFVALIPCDHLVCHTCMNALINSAAHKPPRPMVCFDCARPISSFGPAWETTNGQGNMLAALRKSIDTQASSRTPPRQLQPRPSTTISPPAPRALAPTFVPQFSTAPTAPGYYSTTAYYQPVPPPSLPPQQQQHSSAWPYPPPVFAQTSFEPYPSTVGGPRMHPFQQAYGPPLPPPPPQGAFYQPIQHHPNPHPPQPAYPHTAHFPTTPPRPHSTATNRTPPTGPLISPQNLKKSSPPSAQSQSKVVTPPTKRVAGGSHSRAGTDGTQGTPDLTRDDFSPVNRRGDWSESTPEHGRGGAGEMLKTPPKVVANDMWTSSIGRQKYNTFKSPIEVQQLHELREPTDWPIVRLDNIPWDVTVAQIEDWLPQDSLAPVDKCVLAVHILCNRADGRTLNQCYIEASSITAARNIVRTRDGRKLLDRPVHITISSSSEFMSTLFPSWEPGFNGLDPIPGNTPGPLLLQTEVTGLVSLCKLESPHACKVKERPYMNIVTVLQKFPWHQVESYNSKAVVRLYNAAAEILGSVRDFVPDWQDILMTLVDAVIACPVFRTSQKTAFLRATGMKHDRYPTGGHGRDATDASIDPSFSFSPTIARAGDSYVTVGVGINPLDDGSPPPGLILDLAPNGHLLHQPSLLSLRPPPELRPGLSKAVSAPNLQTSLGPVIPGDGSPVQRKQRRRRLSSISKNLGVPLQLVAAIAAALDGRPLA